MFLKTTSEYIEFECIIKQRHGKTPLRHKVDFIVKTRPTYAKNAPAYAIEINAHRKTIAQKT